MPVNLKKVLIIQTAFIGDVILATALVEKLKNFYPNAHIDFFLRKGNESILSGHPYLNQVIIWDKKGGKYKNLYKILQAARAKRYNLIINLQRFATTGLFTILAGGSITVGFDKNPFSFFFTRKFPHKLDDLHEVERNLSLIKGFTDNTFIKPKLYPSSFDFEQVALFKSQPYICIAPGSVWFTKQFPKEKWIELINHFKESYKVYLLGGPGDRAISESIISSTNNKNVENFAGKLSLLQSAALMKDAVVNYVNDSGPMHLASAMNANTVAVFCSTVPAFGFGPLADQSKIVQTELTLSCKPCGLHGYQKCPLGHFKCAYTIEVGQLELENFKVLD